MNVLIALIVLGICIVAALKEKSDWRYSASIICAGVFFVGCVLW